MSSEKNNCNCRLGPRLHGDDSSRPNVTSNPPVIPASSKGRLTSGQKAGIQTKISIV